ncbi:DUF294 nucleotidyltransferase-like domain-containing protein [Planktotalea sp.]|uniref:DUF294 nucleotidyltransferase-like domain-containing protein n=1 Tax=Planktotalea sp. TaxID=2029877 RepID=UPI003D6B4365
MALSTETVAEFLQTVHPYDSLDPAERGALADQITSLEIPKDQVIYALGDTMDALYIIYSGNVAVSDDTGAPLSQLTSRNSFGERALMRGGIAGTSARTQSDTVLLTLPAHAFQTLQSTSDAVRRFFDRSRPVQATKQTLATQRVDSLMSSPAISCATGTSAQQAASQMRDTGVSALCVENDGELKGILTNRDLTSKILADARDPETPVAEIMTQDPMSLPPSAIGSDVLHLMMEKHIGHVPIVEAGKLVGIVTQTDLTRVQAVTSGEIVAEIAGADTAEDMALVTSRIPQLLMQLVTTGTSHEVVTRLITDIADAATRRLLALAELKLGAPPVPYLWLACGSQGRQEQTGVSDQDNCLIIHDDMKPEDDTYFKALANFVCDGLDTCGYIYCPGDMMASADRWRQPLAVWKGYFDRWIETPDKEAQMLASVMFDLRPIGGEQSLFENLQNATLDKAAKNSIFVGHMIANSLGHTPPLGLFGGLTTVKDPAHKNQIDMKHNGVVPVVDLGRVYALQGKLIQANTRARLVAAQSAGVLSTTGGADLLAAYDFIAQTRLEHQANQVKAGVAPDNFLAPNALPDFDRSHLRDAFVVIKTMQSAIGHGRGML